MKTVTVIVGYALDSERVVERRTRACFARPRTNFPPEISSRSENNDRAQFSCRLSDSFGTSGK